MLVSVKHNLYSAQAMERERILAELKAERDRLNVAISALEGLGTSSGSRRGVRSARTRPRRRRRLTAAGRKRLSQLMKQRWAARKAKGKSTL